MKKTLVIAAIVLAGCATAGRMNNLSVGMSKADVIATMGNPSDTSSQGRTEYLRYHLLQPGVGMGEYLVRLVDGAVDAYGRAGDLDLTKDPSLNVRIKDGHRF